MPALKYPTTSSYSKAGVCSLVLLAASLAGCGRDPFACVPVSGQVTLDGQPLATARVIFSPQGDGKSAIVGPISYCITDENGNYQLATPHGKQGAVIGTHSVSICGEVRDEANPELVLVKEYLPARYWRGKELTFDVPDYGTDEAHFALTSDKKK
ncbi:DUF4198 domain-containing protein [Blastopirellula sp. JC732]|uniref:DUF4198 domain-containing protein n=1 Tax=Blastopirellula sediminis TaxID=2894196 RepID=A0A9X1MH62_9BACT|nr:DUF4198 domain-containing protein [Blastopirellula sediminis]MCC9608189.1 DUF4198 domain-containing protein [Blastopirellula sediminis]MCC9627018.1 DUF4198 domain-containing protein [Blastopirellula sediminis]